MLLFTYNIPMPKQKIGLSIFVGTAAIVLALAAFVIHILTPNKPMNETTLSSVTTLVSPQVPTSSPYKVTKNSGDPVAIIPLSTSTTAVTTSVETPIILPPIASTTTSPSDAGDPPQLSVDPQTIVGILCYYNATYTNQNTGQSIYSADDEEVRGSGVIVNNKGNILTNRHIIEQPDSTISITDNNGNSVPFSITYQLDHCDVGQLPAGATLPTASQIELVNPYIQVPVLGYTAQPVYISQTAGLSNAEVQYADFALLQITGVSSSGPTFGINSVPSSFPYATLLPVQSYPDVINGQVLTYGFPGDVTSGQGNFFQTLTMTGSVGTVTNVEYGDQYYLNTPLLIDTNLEISHGRSGSPLFWRGYVIGLVTFFVGDNQTDSGSVASDAILKALQGTYYIQND
jgi:hypothetical protein